MTDRPALQEQQRDGETVKPRSVLHRNRNFLLLWSGESISLLGSQISLVALPSLAVLVFGAGAFGVAALVALQWLPFIFLAPIMGVFTDRLRRKPLMQVANVARMLILGSLPIAAALGGLTMAQLYSAAALKGVFDVVFQLSYQALMPQLLDRADLAEGNAKTQLSVSVSQVLGRSIGGGLVSAVGAARAVAGDALSYVASIIGLAMIDKERAAPAASGRGIKATLADLRGGAKLTFGNRLLRSLMLMATFGNMAVSLTLAMIVVFAYRNLHFNGAQLGLALGLGSASIILGAMFSRKINARLGMGRTLILTHTLLGLAFLLLPAATSGGKGFAFAVIVVSQCISSFTSPIANVGIMTLIQKTTPPQAMGRVGGVSLPFVWGANAVGPLLGSAIAAAFADTAVVFFVAAGLAWTAVLWIFVGSVQKITDEVPEELRLQL
ncbi:MAG TPA: MFS transporter [Actinocrinis sp.]|nr:MFS transporter [Actinocrinis sp.]